MLQYLPFSFPIDIPFIFDFILLIGCQRPLPYRVNMPLSPGSKTPSPLTGLKSSIDCARYSEDRDSRCSDSTFQFCRLV